MAAATPLFKTPCFTHSMFSLLTGFNQTSTPHLRDQTLPHARSGASDTAQHPSHAHQGSPFKVSGSDAPELLWNAGLPITMATHQKAHLLVRPRHQYGNREQQAWLQLCWAAVPILVRLLRRLGGLVRV